MPVKMATLLGRALAATSALAFLTAAANAATCLSAVTAQGRAPHGANFDPPRKYDTEAMARTRAITAWTEAVRARCPGNRDDWSRASSKKVECEGYAGGIGCSASAIPAK